jgi:hypothetical protein
MKLNVGQTLYSTVDSTAVIVVRAPDADVTITCGGEQMTAEKPADSADSAAAAPTQDGTLLGKRYADEDLGLELLCTKPGPGALEVNGAPLQIKQAKPLPASD